MTKQVLNFEDFEMEKLSKKEQKTVRGGDTYVDPSKGIGS
ncbi:rSAM-modified peptide [Flavobacterium psychroterrae]|uniref:RSAM-modified peptide n=1 Tax=Flavobacterium psychroterrae TaxID=2133767 RepID=A0ABS5P7R2_9FLAO|nr:rSAM-modified peptide [Flavobacterium psychroterrae]MBS7230176.1 rSAM-modified peptide [Flavobacterium psychroterrae]